MNAVDPEVSIPTASLEAVGITEEECRAMLRDVAETLNSRSRCCWNLGWLGPIMLIFWWLDLIFQTITCGCCGGPTHWLCLWPAMGAVGEVLAVHNAKLKARGVGVLVSGADEVIDVGVDGTGSMQLTEFAIQVVKLKSAPDRA